MGRSNREILIAPKTFAPETGSSGIYRTAAGKGKHGLGRGCERKAAGRVGIYSTAEFIWRSPGIDVVAGIARTSAAAARDFSRERELIQHGAQGGHFVRGRLRDAQIARDDDYRRATGKSVYHSRHDDDEDDDDGRNKSHRVGEIASHQVDEGNASEREAKRATLTPDCHHDRPIATGERIAIDRR